MKLNVELTNRSYPVIIEKGIINRIGEYVDLDRKVMIISDTGVPSVYVDVVKKQCPKVEIHVFPMGEKNKNIVEYEKCLRHLLDCSFGRRDLIIALGGGVVGDLAGFVASTYKRGIEFVNIPTTTLSQIDSSIGGKVGIDLNGVKNSVGAFHQPTAVLIDPDTLNTLSTRHFFNGLVEALKMGMTSNEKLVDLLEQDDILSNIEEILFESLMVKKKVVEEDEFETGIRKVLNFGHTIGHAIESTYELSGLLHGEAVAVGMLKILDNEELKDRLLAIYQKWNLNTEFSYDVNTVYKYMLNDKKGSGEFVTIVQVETIGRAQLLDVTFEQLKEKL